MRGLCISFMSSCFLFLVGGGAEWGGSEKFVDWWGKLF